MNVKEWRLRSNPWRWVVIALVIMGLTIGTALWLLWQGAQDRDRQIEGLLALNNAKQNVVEDLCSEKPKDPACRKAERLPEPEAVVDDPEIQEPEIDDPDPNDPDPFDDPDPDDPEKQDPEQQNAEQQEREIQDPEIQDEETQDPEIQESETQDPEIDDPDPNSMLNFEVDDSCSPPEGEYITDVGLDVRRSEGTVTYVITCTSAPFSPGGGTT